MGMKRRNFGNMLKILKLKKFRRENFNENRTGVAPFDHPKKVYDEFIKEDYIAPSSKENNK